jgi:hypothetical protein
MNSLKLYIDGKVSQLYPSLVEYKGLILIDTQPIHSARIEMIVTRDPSIREAAINSSLPSSRDYEM